MTTPRTPTILDVAREAGVSRQTVTRALNDMADIAPATRERVVAAAQLLGYRPNRAAQSLVKGSGTTIGLLVESLRNPYYAELASELSRAAAARGWGLILCDVGYGTDRDARLSPLLRRVDALVGCLPAGATADVGVPFVSIDNPDETVGDATVWIDHEAGVRAALAHLVATGRRSIAMIDSGPEPSTRCLAYRAFLAEAGLPWSEQSEVRVEESHDGGIAAAAQLLGRGIALDAVLAFNDVLAIGAMKEMARAGKRVPEDVAVVGMDGLDVGALVTPELTTAATDRGVIAAAALDLVDALLTGDRPRASRERDTGGPHGAAAPGAEAGGRPRRTVEPYLVARGSA
ncbi:LacI family DNA-binding transcriptional regulator [Sanguibacter sp. 4.1]|uniref:LacI family DNA-binding transcriptional regulator n=1 Tax=Sanguibacter biliveldensis TaxID=3030830 RepID=A0AAF0Z6Y8_9MICO|nr:LacI family DNA-binding transcriptional regulator [Sanguibacter sp. 4.1]WPF82222.1 LacI family DNA-binding transcriptional regulator [Sanguibacter sp. 4.1]